MQKFLPQNQAEVCWLIERRGVAAVRLAYHLTRDREAALDLSQEAFVRALENIHTLEDPARLNVWFDRILVNLSRDWLRMRSTERRSLEAAPSVRLSPPDPLLLAEREEEAERARAALLGLPLDYREALALVAVEGLTPREAAYALGVPDGTLRYRLHEGRRLMREALGMETDEQGA